MASRRAAATGTGDGHSHVVRWPLATGHTLKVWPEPADLGRADGALLPRQSHLCAAAVMRAHSVAREH